MAQPSQEQIAEMQEKLKHMSPEELRDFQKQQCIFCHIISGKVQSRSIYEDDKVKALLDINPANPGHVLLLPKEHYSIMPQVPEDIIEHLAKVMKHLSAAVLKALQAEGTTIFIANGVAAGQRAQHFMIHIIPRMEKDDLVLDLTQHPVAEKDLALLRKKLQPAINKAFGIAPQEEAELETKEPVMPPKKPSIQEAEFEDIVAEPVTTKMPHTQKETRHDHLQQTPAPKPKEQKKEPPKKAATKKKESKQQPSEKSEVTLDDIASLLTGN